MKGAIKRRLQKSFEEQPLFSSEYGSPSYEGTSTQKAINYWNLKSQGTKVPPMEYMRGRKSLPREPYRIPKGSEIPYKKRGWLFKKT